MSADTSVLEFTELVEDIELPCESLRADGESAEYIVRYKCLARGNVHEQFSCQEHVNRWLALPYSTYICRYCKAYDGGYGKPSENLVLLERI